MYLLVTKVQTKNPCTSAGLFSLILTIMKNLLALSCGLLFLVLIHSCQRGNNNVVLTTTTGCKSGHGATDIDGNNYTSTIIGLQEWMVENLKVTKYKNGDLIPNVTDNTQWSSLTTGGWCYYNNDPLNNSTYGKLYNWYTVNDSRGIAPTGWHIPTQTEWQTLANYLGGDHVAGGKMKEVGTAHWSQTDSTVINSSCFTGLPGGERNYNISTPFFQLGEFGNWWSNTDATTLNGGTPSGWKIDIQTTYLAPVNFGYTPKLEGYSVRCIKD
jgi:uncharacterized protein (TIGR02145 family)